MTPDPLSSSAPTSERVVDTSLALQIGGAATLAAIIAGIGVAAFLWPTHRTPLDIVVVAVDASLTSDVTGRCEDLERLAIDAADQAKGDLRLTILASGDGSLAMQSQLVGTATLAHRAGLVEVDKESPRRAFFAAVHGLCEQIPTRTESPLFQLVRAAQQDAVLPPGAGPEVTVRIYVRTDGIEEVDPVLTAAIEAAAGWDTRPAHQALPTDKREHRLDGGAAKIQLCGLSARRVKPGKHAPPGLDQVAAAWQPEVSDPSTLTFAASCAPGVDSARVAAAMALVIPPSE